jgi:hypothetical protein
MISMGVETKKARRKASYQFGVNFMLLSQLPN